ncbi:MULTISPECIES: SDR family NAD(P)-dependent oxidoreductase [unclassified Mycobacterium]|uniref:SDR family NAD(P)-dependent oxidoreductase n=1 Tax=unclassified Mycobacterium TaxID=2642494 RepID=UPI0009937D11|nr:MULTISPECIES: SDR family NAD(P)-dependent oxidoreductase [unclassified Mycobacterium]
MTTTSQGSVAVVGMGLVAPGVSSPQDFWRVLCGSRNTLREPSHIDLDHWFHPDPSTPDKTYVRVGGFLGDFDPHPDLAKEQALGYWGGADRTAVLLRHSLLQAMDSLTINQGDRLGAYIGAQPGGLALEDAILMATARAAQRSSSEALRGRYRHAPGRAVDAFPDRMVRAACRDLLPEDSDVLVVDTACSSSLYAVDLGVKSLLAGERDVVLCGGANIGSRRDMVLFAKLRGLSTTGEIRAFDTDAAGVLFSDAAAVVALKRRECALADGDEILGLLAGFGGSADGEGSVMASSPKGQRRAVDRARSVNAVEPEAVTWFVAHGTGTRVGDDVELETLTGAAGSGQTWCTSNKPLIGHGAWAAGAFNVIHAVLAMRHGEIPGERYFTEFPSTARTDRIVVPTESVSWSASPAARRIAGVCAYGFGGTNAHLLVQAPDSESEPPLSAPRRGAGAVLDDPMVLVGSSVHFPGSVSQDEITHWLCGDGVAPSRSFGPDYPLPPISELRMPPVNARSIDRTHLMGLAVVRDFVGQHGELWSETCERTGVFTGHTGPTRAMVEYSVRVGADDLRAALADTPEDMSQLEAELATLNTKLPEANERSMTGQLTNIISSMVVNRYRLGGMAMNVDCGRSSTQGALHAAERYLSSGELDFAIVIGLNGHSTEFMAGLSGLAPDELAEGAVMLALTRRSVAEKSGWPIRAILRTDAARTGRHIGVPGAVQRCYLGADGALAVLRAVGMGHRDPITVHNLDPAPLVRVEPAGAETGPAVSLPERSVMVLRRADAQPVHERLPAIEPGTLVLTHSAEIAQQLAQFACAAGAPIVCTAAAGVGSDDVLILADDGPQAAIDAAMAAMGTRFRRLLIVASVRVPGSVWPAPPAPELLALQECALVAAAALGEKPPADSTVTALLLDPLRRESIHPYMTLITGFVRALAHEIPNPVFAVVTDAALRTALEQVAAESASARDRAVVYYRQGLRYIEKLCAAPLPESRRGGRLPWERQPVIVATGGARGATAAVVTALASRARPVVWLLGTTPDDAVPADILTAGEGELAARRAEFLAREREIDSTATIISLNARFEALLRAREIRRTLRLLEHLCGVENVHYLVCDVRDREQVQRAAKTVRTRHDRVDFLIHGAGRIHSASVSHKPIDEFRAVRDIKVAGYHHLKEAFSDPPPALWCNFGSGSALLGCGGDTDYVSANEYLCAAARYEDGNEFTPAWGLWTETGMVRDIAEQLSRQYKFTGITNDHGAALMLSELAVPHPLDPVPFYGISPAFADAVPDGGCEREQSGPLLDPVEPTTRAAAEWVWCPSSTRDGYLAEHLFDGRPVLPAVMMLAMAAEAASSLNPELEVTGFSDLQIAAPVYADVPAAMCRVTAETIGPEDVWIELRSDVVTRDGRVLVPDRLHCRVRVHLGRFSTSPPAQAVRSAPLLEDDPAVRPDVSAQLSGVWRTLHRSASDSAGASAICRPHAQANSIFARLRFPALVLDSTLRLFGYPPQPDGTQIMAVPTAAERIDFYAACTDVTLAERYPAGVDLSYDAACGRAVASADGRTLLTVTNLTIHPIDYLPSEIPYQEWYS